MLFRSMLDDILRTDINFDMLKKDIQIAGVDGVLYTIDGFFKDSVLEKIMEFLEGLESSQFSLDNLDNFLKSKLPYVEISTYDDDQQLSDAVLMGQTAMLLDGFSKGIVLDLRTYPQRGIEAVSYTHLAIVVAGQCGCSIILKLHNAHRLRRHSIGNGGLHLLLILF